MKLQHKEIKKALRKEQWVNPFTLGKYSVAPYRACQHGCKYCDGRAEKYYIEGDFETDIIVRSNLPQLLALELPKVKERGIVSFGSGVTDVYQPSEGKEGLMRQCAELLAMHPFPVSVLTKSSLILRDLDLWEKVHHKNGFILMVSLTFLDDEMRQIFEPHASSVKERLEMIAEFKKRGMHVGVLAMPFIPFLTDHSAHLAALMQKLTELKVDFMMPGGLTLRPGRQKELFLDTVRGRLPHLLPHIERLYQEDRPSGNPLPSYSRELSARFHEVAKAYAIPPALPHAIYRNMMPLQDELYILLSHMIDLYARRGISVSPLQQSFKRYAAWLLEAKRVHSRKSRQHVQEANDRIDESIVQGELESILQNRKLHRFIMEVAAERKVFNYLSLKLENKSIEDLK
ncbi:radical SAM protein [Gorillibacterium sp. CAU 1737]|uniref:SPL family radical SAM protein n=1 Tax=Gorillibacterium sp. CAU 1737 TaxID=3140362 RepID=UPI003260507D